MNIQKAEAALQKVAERNGIPLETVRESIRAAIQQSELGRQEAERGRTITPEEMVAFLGNVLLEVRQKNREK